MTPNYLALQFQTLILRLSKTKEPDLVTTTKKRIFNDWNQFLTSFETTFTTPNSTYDISLEYMAFKLFLYYYLDTDQRQAILLKVFELLSQGSQTTEQSILLITRLLIICDYLIQNPNKPNQSLLVLVNTSLLSLNATTNLSNLFSSNKHLKKIK